MSLMSFKCSNSSSLSKLYASQQLRKSVSQTHYCKGLFLGFIHFTLDPRTFAVVERHSFSW